MNAQCFLVDTDPTVCFKCGSAPAPLFLNLGSEIPYTTKWCEDVRYLCEKYLFAKIYLPFTGILDFSFLTEKKKNHMLQKLTMSNSKAFFIFFCQTSIYFSRKFIFGPVNLSIYLSKSWIYPGLAFINKNTRHRLYELGCWSTRQILKGTRWRERI